MAPPPTRRMMSIQMPAMSASGITQPKSRSRQSVFSTRPENSTWCVSSSVTSCESSTPGMRVTVNRRTLSSEPRSRRSWSARAAGGSGRALGLARPVISRSVRDTLSILFSRTSSRNFDMGSSTVRGATNQLWSSERTTAPTRT